LKNFNLSELRKAVDECKVVPLLGAGISASSPSSLPPSAGLTVPIRDVLYKSIYKFRSETNLARKDFDTCNFLIGKAPLESLLDALQTPYGNSALEYLVKVLATKEFNENHRGISLLAKAKKISWIITLNFDLLIETALNDIHIENVETICPLTDGNLSSDSISQTGVRIVKPHGTLIQDIKGNFSSAKLSTTLRVLGQEPNSRTIDAFNLIFKEHPFLLVGGYAGGDWDIVPILEEFVNRNLIKTIFWIQHPQNEKQNKEAKEYIDSLFKGDSCQFLIEDFTKILKLISPGFVPLHEGYVNQKKTDASTRFSDHGRNLLTVVNLLGIAGEANPAIVILEWLKSHSERRNNEWDYLISRKLSFMEHLAEKTRESLREHERAIILINKLSADWELEKAESYVWGAYTYLSLLKPHRIFRPFSNFKQSLEFYKKAKELRDKANEIVEQINKPSRVQALGAHFFADLKLSWLNLFMILGKFVSPICRYFSRRILKGIRTSPGYTDVFFSSGYWGLRYLELRILAGELKDDEKIEEEKRRLEIRKRFYELSQSNVERGNGHAYLAFIAGFCLPDIKTTICELKCAEKIWKEQSPPSLEGLARVIIFGRFCGCLSLFRAIKNVVVLIRKGGQYVNIIDFGNKVNSTECNY
jgi:SIR2-like domain